MHSVFILLVASLAAADQVPDNAGPDDKLIQGRWEYVFVRSDGQPFPLEKGDYLTITGRNWSIHRNKMVLKAKHTLDPSENPKHLNLAVQRDGQVLLPSTLLLGPCAAAAA